MKTIHTQKLIEKLKEAFLPKNVECEGVYCMGCWKDVVREAIKMIEQSQEQPLSEEPKEIIKSHFIHYFGADWEIQYEAFNLTPSFEAMRQLLEHVLENKQTLSESEISAKKIALGFAERFQNNYPEKPLHGMMIDLSNDIQQYASQLLDKKEEEMEKLKREIIQNTIDIEAFQFSNTALQSELKTIKNGK